MTGSWALFVDAGWLFAASSDSIFSKLHPRQALRWDAATFIPALVERASELVPADAKQLRTYWYDGSRNRLPDDHHVPIAETPDVKLRLGRLTPSGQKGVDGLIIHDLIMLSLQGRLEHAVVISGDDDLLEAIESAQRVGTRVHLLEVPFGGVSRDLLRTFDRRGTLDREFLSQYIELLSPTVVTSTPPGINEPASPVAVPPSAPPDRPEWMDSPLPGNEPTSPVAGDLLVAEASAAEFGRQWLEIKSDAQQIELLSQRPFLGAELDAALLRYASSPDYLNRWLHDDERIVMRETFWSTIANGVTGEP